MITRAIRPGGLVSAHTSMDLIYAVPSPSVHLPPPYFDVTRRGGASGGQGATVCTGELRGEREGGTGGRDRGVAHRGRLFTRRSHNRLNNCSKVGIPVYRRIGVGQAPPVNIQHR